MRDGRKDVGQIGNLPLAQFANLRHITDRKCLEMKISAFHIDGFGVFHDFGVPELGDGIIVFHGPNEAGKSTLLDFIRYTLFGYPRRSKKANLREPLCGGRHGGRVQILLGQGESLTVECYAGEPPRVSGHREGDRFLAEQILHNLNRDTFEGLFAFALDELSNARFEIPAELESTLLDAAQAGRMRSPASVRAELVQEKDAIYKERGRKQSLVVELGRLADLRRAVEECQRRPREYEEKRNALEAIDEKLRAARALERSLSTQLERNRQLIDVRQPFLDWRAARRTLDRTEKVEDFPADGVARLDKQEAEIAARMGEIEKKRAKIAELEHRRSARPVDQRWIDKAAAIEQLVRRHSGVEQHRARARKIDGECKTLRRRRDDAFQQLGEDWTADKVVAVTTGLLAEERIRRPHNRIAELERDLANERKETDDQRGQLELLEAQLRQRIEVFESDPDADPETLQLRLAALSEWLEVEAESRRVVDWGNEQERRLSQLRRDLGDLDARREALDRPPQPVSVWIALAAGGAVAGAVGLYVMTQGSLSAGLALLVVCACLGLAAGGVRRADLRSRDEAREELERLASRREDIQAETDRLEADLQQGRDAIAEYTQQQEAVVERAGIDPSAPRAVILEDRRRTEQAYAEAAQLRTRIEELERQVDEVHRRVEARRASVETLEGELEQARADLAAALGAVGLPAGLSAETAINAFKAIRDLQNLIAEEKRLSDEHAKEVGAVEDFARASAALAKELRFEFSGEDDRIWEGLKRRLEEERAAAERAREIGREIEAAEREIKVLEQALARSTKERSELLEAGGAPGDAERFRRRSEKAAAYTEALARANEAWAKLDARRPADQSAEQFVERLRKTDWAAVESEIEPLEAEHRDARDDLSRLQEERGGLRNEIRQLEREEELFALRQQQEAARARLAEWAHRWNVLAVAEALMQRVQEIYERERQPARIRRASELFEQFTRGSFKRVRIDDDGDGLVAVRENLEELRPHELSRGTCEQLYLALRLALVDELARRGIVLPLVFDDILVNFDDRRARATAETLAGIARDRQLWFFTAHEPTLRMWREVGVAREVPLEVRRET